MILNSPVQSRRLAVGLPLAFAALAWAGFVLTGVARADDPQPQAADQPEHIFVEAEADDAGEVDIKIIKGEQAGPGKLLWAEEAGRPERLKVHMRRLGVPSEQELAEFLTAHPTADANADGKLIHAERSAFLAALAMHDPSGVIQQFPNADNNGDGQLSEEEAAQLVTGGMFMRRIEGPRTAEGVKMAQEDVVIARFERRKGDAKPLLERTTNPNDAATWLLANVVYAPAATEVAQYVEVVEAAPFAAMLKRRPEADTDGDGKLSPAEREAFFKLDRQHVDAMLLKHFPEADTNGDGVLSPDEIKAIKGNRVIVKHKQNADGTDSESVRVNGAEGGHEVFIIKTEEKETSDK